MAVKGLDKLQEFNIDLDWHKARGIQAIDYDIVQDEYYTPYSVLRLRLIFDLNGKNYDIVVRFSNVTNFSLNGIGGGYIQLLGLAVTDKAKDGWENDCRYYVNDYEDGKIHFSCQEIEILEVKEFEDEQTPGI